MPIVRLRGGGQSESLPHLRLCVPQRNPGPDRHARRRRPTHAGHLAGPVAVWFVAVDRQRRSLRVNGRNRSESGPPPRFRPGGTATMCITAQVRRKEKASPDKLLADFGSRGVATALLGTHTGASHGGRCHQPGHQHNNDILHQALLHMGASIPTCAPAVNTVTIRIRERSRVAALPAEVLCRIGL